MLAGKKKSIRILGVDPGSLCTGYGIIDVNNGRLNVVECGLVRNRNDHAMALRYARIYEGLREVIEENKPDCMSIEKTFYCKNIQSAFKLGEARGIAILLGAQYHLDIYEYEPRRIKKAVVGYGAAHKLQVQAMVQSILRLKKRPKSLDVTDALAIAICHANQIHQIK